MVLKHPTPDTRRLIASMIGAVLLVGGLAFWDESRESVAELEDFAQDQASLAASAATQLATRLEDVRRDALILADDAAEGRLSASRLAEDYLAVRVENRETPRSLTGDGQGYVLSVPASRGRRVDLLVSSKELLGGLGRIERPNSVMVFIRPPGQAQVQTADGRVRNAEPVQRAFDAGGATLTLSRDDAAKLGLPPRMAIAGLSHVDAGPLGRWGVAVVATALRERDRERRAVWRLVLAIGLAAGLVLAFGGVALRKQRQEMELARELAVAEASRASEERLERESRAATMLTLASGVAHELSTPLGIIGGRAEQLLARANGDERAARGAQAILDQVEHISRVIRGLLGLARGGTPALEEVPPAEVVRGAFALVEHRFAKAEVALGSRLAEALPELRCDRKLLEHALVNLLLNACDACPRGGHVQVDVRRDDTGVAFVVTDDGAGITPANAARAAEPFFTTKSQGMGSGLGLAIANEIAKSHHGSLSIGPAEPRGTRACIRLPLAQGAPDARA